VTTAAPAVATTTAAADAQTTARERFAGIDGCAVAIRPDKRAHS
jgi:hypothetical protein